MKLEVNLSKKYFFGILLIGLILIGIVGVFAHTTGNLPTTGVPGTFGHSTDEIDWAQGIASDVGIGVSPSIYDLDVLGSIMGDRLYATEFIRATEGTGKIFANKFCIGADETKCVDSISGWGGGSRWDSTNGEGIYYDGVPGVGTDTSNSNVGIGSLPSTKALLTVTGMIGSFAQEAQLALVAPYPSSGANEMVFQSFPAPNNYIKVPSASNLKFLVGNTDTMIINSAGAEIGGKFKVSDALDVKGDASVSGDLSVGGRITSVGGNLEIATSSGSMKIEEREYTSTIGTDDAHSDVYSSWGCVDDVNWYYDMFEYKDGQWNPCSDPSCDLTHASYSKDTCTYPQAFNWAQRFECPDGLTKDSCTDYASETGAGLPSNYCSSSAQVKRTVLCKPASQTATITKKTEASLNASVFSVLGDLKVGTLGTINSRSVKLQLVPVSGYNCNSACGMYCLTGFSWQSFDDGSGKGINTKMIPCSQSSYAEACLCAVLG